MTSLILSLDYEIFGNGAGDVMRDVIAPTRRLLDICDKHGAKVTIMFEVGEYWAFEEYDCQLRKDLGYSPVEQMKGQAIDATKRGHDVQLHLHPEWINAKYEKGVWQLNHSCGRLADLPGGLGSKDNMVSITGALHAGKRTLEDMIRPVDSQYQCIGLRVSGFYARPSADIITAMKAVGLRADSSVVKGHKREEPFAVDYSQVKIDKSAWWTTGTELIQEGNMGEHVLEIPVSSQVEPYWMNFKATKLRAALKRRSLENGSDLDKGTKTRIRSFPRFGTVMKLLFRQHANMFDFCKFSSRDMLQRMDAYTKSAAESVMLLGHSKDFFNDRHFDCFLERMSLDEDVKFQTMSEFLAAKLLTR